MYKQQNRILLQIEDKVWNSIYELTKSLYYEIKQKQILANK